MVKMNLISVHPLWATPIAASSHFACCDANKRIFEGRGLRVPNKKKEKKHAIDMCFANVGFGIFFLFVCCFSTFYIAAAVSSLCRFFSAPSFRAENFILMCDINEMESERYCE